MRFTEMFTLNRAWYHPSEGTFFWEPVPGSWSVRRRDQCLTPNPFGTGDWVVDFDGGLAGAAVDGKTVEPLTTIAWLFWHVGSMPAPAAVLDFLGGTKTAESGWTAPCLGDHPVFSAPCEAVKVMRTGWRALDRAIRTSIGEDLDQAHGSGATRVQAHQHRATRSSPAFSMRSAITAHMSACCAICTGQWLVEVLGS
jgi:hypothetical protein